MARRTRAWPTAHARFSSEPERRLPLEDVSGSARSTKSYSQAIELGSAFLRALCTVCSAFLPVSSSYAASMALLVCGLYGPNQWREKPTAQFGVS